MLAAGCEKMGMDEYSGYNTVPKEYFFNHLSQHDIDNLGEKLSPDNKTIEFDENAILQVFQEAEFVKKLSGTFSITSSCKDYVTCTFGCYVKILFDNVTYSFDDYKFSLDKSSIPVTVVFDNINSSSRMKGTMKVTGNMHIPYSKVGGHPGKGSGDMTLKIKLEDGKNLKFRLKAI